MREPESEEMAGIITKLLAAGTLFAMVLAFIVWFALRSGLMF